MKKKEIKEYLKRSDIAIEGNTASWNISANGDVNGTYHGLFRFKCFLTPTEKLAAGRTYRELLGPNASLAFQNEDNLAFSLSQLRYRIIEAPPFWTSAIGINGLSGDLPDEKVIDIILEAAVASEFKYKAQIENKKHESLKRSKEAAETLLDRKDDRDPEESEDDEG